MSKTTEKKLKESQVPLRSFINWVAISEWIERDKPYKEHKEILSQQQHENGIAHSGHDGKSIDLVVLDCV
ncbi:36636_t:CDS:1, partial [Gigaspora margarita]